MAQKAANQASTFDHPGELTTSSGDTLIEGIGATRIDDTFACETHGDKGQVIETGCATVYINGKPAAREASEVPCPPVATLVGPTCTVLVGGETATKLADGVYAILVGGHCIAYYQALTADQVAEGNLDSCGMYTLATLFAMYMDAQGLPLSQKDAYALVLLMTQLGLPDRIPFASAYLPNKNPLDDPLGFFKQLGDFLFRSDKGGTPLYGASDILSKLGVDHTTGTGLDAATLDALLADGNAVGAMIQWDPNNGASLHWISVVGSTQNPDGTTSYIVVNSATDPSKTVANGQNVNGQNVEVWSQDQLMDRLEHGGNIPGTDISMSSLGDPFFPSGAYVAVPMGEP